MDKCWKDIKGYEGYYQISNLGDVKSLPRLIDNRYYSKEKILKGYSKPATQKGIKFYSTVQLSRKGKVTQFYVHRLVATAFISNPENKPEVNHISKDTLDCSVGNLEWVTSQENTNHKINEAGGCPWIARGSKSGASKLTEEDVLDIKLQLKAGVKNYVLADVYKIDRSVISKIKTNKSWVQVKTPL